MPKERRILTVSSNTSARVSPYPLRSSRTKKQKAPESLVQTQGVRQWEDVRCVICLEPPHNAVLLHCSSSSNGCRPYMCDTSARHSNCFKQYRRNNGGDRLNPKSLNCPLCRGEVYDTIKVSGARRFMNAKPRSCSSEDCHFSGTYSQLKNHLKTDHPGFIPPKVDPRKQRVWEQMQRDAEFVEIMAAAGVPHRPEVVLYTHPRHPLVHLGVDEVLPHSMFGDRQVRSGFGVVNYAASALMPRLDIRAMTMFHAWTP